MSQNPSIIYIFDTLCGWCNVARPEVNKIFEALGGEISLIPMHRRLFTADYIPSIDASFLQKVRRVGWKVGPEMTGQKFSEAYVELITNPNFRHDSLLSSIGCAAAYSLTDSKQAFRYAEHLQSLLFDHGKNPNLEATLIEAADLTGIEKSSFKKSLGQEETFELAISFAVEAESLQRRTRANGVPVLLLDTGNDLVSLDPYHADETLSQVQRSLGLLSGKS